MALKEYKGNLFDSQAQTLVNTVNCVGVMGKGVALEFRRRFPEMTAAYEAVCADRMLKPGQILPYLKGSPWILNFAVKRDWKFPSRIEWVESCLEKFVARYGELGITSCAMPWLGAMNGGLPWTQVHQLMRDYLAPLDDIDVEIVEFDPDATDPIFRRIQAAVGCMDATAFGKAAGMIRPKAEAIWRAVAEGEVQSLSRLIEMDGIGETTVDHLYESFRADGLLRPLVADDHPRLF
jgi:O-acetyl-ADP-ribose deacetylase (regulator of RNase III)